MKVKATTQIEDDSKATLKDALEIVTEKVNLPENVISRNILISITVMDDKKMENL